ncbi:MAG: ATP-binding protein [Rhabdochlamydiaceae bacterium]
MSKFIGRKRELEALRGLLQKKNASLVVIRGRRRIGKSRLAEEYASSFNKAYILSGIPPEPGTTSEIQRAEFLRQLQEYRLPIYRSDDWGNLFYDLAQESKKGRVLVVLDEITWMGSHDPTFLPKLKTAWDRYFKKNPQFVMVLSGCNSAWISKNILSSTGFFGRISLRLVLEELSLSECNAFWKDQSGTISAYEKFKILSVTGGIPRYLEELRPDLSAEANLQRLCFDSEGLLFREFDQIFHDLFQKHGPFYKQIVERLSDSSLSTVELAKKLDRSRGGDLSKALGELMESGFLSRDYTWAIETGKRSQSSRYRIRDNYLRFYLKYILPHKEQIESTKLQRLPQGWVSIMGLQFENLVVNNGALICKILGVLPEDILIANAYFQTAGVRKRGCQIDYLIQTRFRYLYACEVKFRQTVIGVEVIEEVEEKLSRLKLPRGFSCRPVLIHVNGVSEELVDSGYFAKIIDLSELLTLHKKDGSWTF